MPAPTRPRPVPARLQPGGSDQLTNLGLALLGVLVAVGLLLLAGVELATWAATGHRVRDPQVFSHVLAVLGSGGSPASAFATGSGVPGPTAVWTAVGLVVGLPLLLALLVLVLARRSRRRHAGRRLAVELNQREGMATRADVLAAQRQLRQELKRYPDLRAVNLGRVHGADWCVSSQQSILAEGPARSGKTSTVIIPAIAEWRGSVVSTSTKDDVLRFTLLGRAASGPVWVFDPERPAGVGGFGWSPVVGCESLPVARRRADDMVKAAAPTGNVENGGFFDGQARIVVKCLLHAAALGGASLSTLMTWVLDSTAVEPVQILETHRALREALELTEQRNAPERTRQSVWMTVGLCFEWVTPDVITACEKVPACGPFDARRLLLEAGTLYVEPSEQVQLVSQVLLATLLGDVVQAALDLANGSSSTGRLDPPLLLALDEVANIAPWKGLPGLLSQSGGQGICAILGLQNAAQALDRWGPNQGRLIVENATVRLIFPGLKSAGELQDLSVLLGDRDESTISRSRQRGARADGGYSESEGMRQVRTLAPAEIFGLPPRTVLGLPPNGRPSVLSTVHYGDRPCGSLCQDSDGAVRVVYATGTDLTTPGAKPLTEAIGS